MNATRQDAWSQDEDVLLAETVLKYIRDGKTQLEAFEEVAKRLSRTSAACGFRWNATVRKQYQKAIQMAKEERKNGGKKPGVAFATTASMKKESGKSFSFDDAITLLEKMKETYQTTGISVQDLDSRLTELQQENQQLKQKLARYREAWQEIGKLWDWVN